VHSFISKLREESYPAATSDIKGHQHDHEVAIYIECIMFTCKINVEGWHRSE